MADLITESIELRKQIIAAANIYKRNLAGNVYLYVYGNTYWYVTKDKQDYIKQLKLHKDEYTTTYYKYSHYFICF